ncbi:hypothetical protein CASFOL_014136 [Castilleja foliolosa]|uniref:Uncharacterized protein n=1 Tax=Castilleja foliolosa TaxID=1961234 RepID=A0ABD3DNQ9_9LAMI
MDESWPGPQILSPIGISNSPEFEFCNYIPQSPDLVYAAELFSGGVLLPLHQSNEPPEVPFWSDLEQPEPEVIYAPPLSASSANNTLSSSIKWRDIFRKNDKKSSRRRTIDIQSEKDIIASFMEMKKREKRNSISGGSVTAATELNINLWPFSRSRSTGNGAARSRSGTSAARNVSSAPCSRSNSTGESKSRSCPGSPGRGGVHVGRSSHVCQVRRGGGGGRRNHEAVVRNIPSGDGRSKAKVLNLNLPRFIGYRQHLSCKSDGDGGGGGGVSGEGVRGSSSFNIKSLFTKKM